MLTVLGGLAGIDCDLIRARNGEGRERAKLRGLQAVLTPEPRRETIKRR